MSEENKKLVREFVEECQSQHDLGRMSDFLSSEFVNHTVQPPFAPTFEGAKQLHETLIAAFPDMEFVIRDMGRRRGQGRHLQDPTGNPPG